MFGNFLKNGKTILSLPQESVLKAAFLIMSLGIASRLLGLVRDRLLAHQFGAGEELAAYFAAFRIPDFLFQILIFGTISVAFIPLFTKSLEKNGKKQAFQMAAEVGNVLILFFAALVLLGMLFSKPLSQMIAPGLTDDPITSSILVNLTRILLAAQIILAASSFISSLLQSLKRFLIPAAAPLFYNLGIILGILVLAPHFGIFGVAAGVFFGSFLHFLIQIPLIFSLGFSFKLAFRPFSKGVKSLVTLSLPRSLGLIAGQIGETVDIYLASLISAQSIVAFNFALHLQTVPLGLFALSISQAVLPTLSSQFSSGRIEDFKRTLVSSLHQLFFLILPATAILIVLRVPITRIVFGAANFDWPATLLTATTLAFLSIGLFAQGAVFLISRGFYALHDTRTPLLLGALSVFVNIVLSLYFIKTLGLPVWSLGLAASVGSILNGIFLGFLLQRKIGGTDIKKILIPVLKIFIASLLFAVVAWIIVKILDVRVLDTTKTINLLILTFVSLSIGGIVFIGSCYLLKIRELYLFLRHFLGIKQAEKFLEKQEELVEQATPYI